MDSIVKKYQQRFQKIREEMNRWEELQSQLISQFSNASSIIKRLQVIRDSQNYGALRCVEGIESVLLAKQMDSLQIIFVSIKKSRDCEGTLIPAAGIRCGYSGTRIGEEGRVRVPFSAVFVPRRKMLMDE
ncbi:uncharacterized protein At5g43822-like [Salvia miltiorrhiza]|uniref:uncharacterized protein At5g43822-like n=1 Tax=Salvia miltiorrhiza TaxID=226208 RepID=UPI0025ACEFB4|nr:uncharacterized protein At5g43822-like [Salvia miltiorrhiza]